MVSSARLEDLLKGNEKFRKKLGRAKIGKKNAEHKPKALVVACSDARMSPEHIFQADIGELYVVRNAGNNVLEPGTLGTIEYAVKHLDVKIILILGHYGCEVIEMLYGPADTDYIAILLQQYQYAKSMVEVSGATDKKKAAVVENVKYQVEQLQNRSQIVNQKVQQKALIVVGAVYKMEDGTIEVID